MPNTFKQQAIERYTTQIRKSSAEPKKSKFCATRIDRDDEGVLRSNGRDPESSSFANILGRLVSTPSH